jgi:hypothetical protein
MGVSLKNKAACQQFALAADIGFWNLYPVILENGICVYSGG